MADLSPVPKLQFLDANGSPLVGGKLYTYAAGTTTPLATYANSAGSITNTNPIILDSRGEASVWLGSALYKFKLTTSTDVDVYTVDNIGGTVTQEQLQAFLDQIAGANGSDLVGFVQGGAGAVTRTAQDKLREVKSSGDYNTIANAIADAGTNAIVHVTDTPNYSANTDWQGRQHQTDGAPFNLNNITWTNANLNARMCVNNGMLYCCEYSNNKVALFSLADMRAPDYLGSYAVGSQPRHVEVIGRYMFVCCHGAASIEVYDISNPTGFSGAAVGTITTGANPKMFQILGDEIFVACFGTNKVEKHSFRLPTSGLTGFSSEKLGDVSVSSGPLCLALNGDGLMAVCGLDTANVQIIGTSTLNLLSTAAIGGAGHATCSWVNKTQLLVTDSTNDRLYSCDCSSLTAVVTGFASTSPNPEQIEIVGNRCYVPSLTDPGVTAYLDCFDITNAFAPVKYKSVQLTVTGAGFTAYATDGLNGYVYVNGHFSPYNLDIIEVPSAQSGRTPMNAVGVFFASQFSASASDIGIRTQTFQYRTAIANTSATAEDFFIRVGVGGAVALPDPALMDGKVLIIKNVSASVNSNVTNAFTGYSGTLTPGQAVMIVSTSYAGLAQWDAIASF